MMAALSLPTASPSRFAIVPETTGSSLVFRFRGVADMASIEPLDAYLRSVHAEALRAKAPSVTVDFQSLEFMNSSCFKCFVEWLGMVQDMPANERYRVVFSSNQEMHWQRRSLNALRCFAMDVVSIQVS